MTVINQNSISGITSITAASGSVQIFNSDGSSGSLTDLAGVNVSGVVTATRYRVSAGSTAAPAITPPDDTNTGIFFPSADTIAFGEGGTEAARIDSNGRFGVGAITVDEKLHVEGSSGQNTTIKVESTPTSTERSAIEFFNGSISRGRVSGSNDFDGLTIDSSTTESAAVIRFRTGGGTLTEKARIDSSGRFGIGTQSPADALHVVGKIAVTGTNPSIRQTVQTANLDLCGGTTVGTDSSIQIYGSSSPSDANHTFYNSNVHIWRNAAGTTQYGRFDSSGRLLVGTSSARSNINREATTSITPFAQIETAVQSYNNGLSIINNSASAYGAMLTIGTSYSTSIGSNTIGNSGSQVGTISFVANDGTKFIDCAQIKAEIDGTPGANDMPGRLMFSTTADGASSPTERMRIGSDGRTNILDSSTEGFASRSISAASTSVNLYSGWHSATTVLNGTAVYVVRTNGNVLNANGSYTTLSDSKLKENIVDAGSQWSDLKAIKIRNWNFKEETGYETHRQIGPIAQELEQVCPGLVIDAEDRDAEGNNLGTVTKSVNQSVLYMKAVKALQEAMERIEQLEAEMAEVKAQLS